MEMYRQGDVLVVRTHAIPITATRQPTCVVARGEATGHAHQIKTDAVLWLDEDGTKYVEVLGHEAVLSHEEHGPITLQGPAVYRVTQQREYTPDEIRNVQD